MNLKLFMRNLFLDEHGQSTTEYILILSVVVMVALKFKAAFQTTLTGAVGKLGTDINTALDESNN